MFRDMRTALNIPKSTDILDHLHSLSTDLDSVTIPPTSPRQRGNEAIETIERNAMVRSLKPRVAFDFQLVVFFSLFLVPEKPDLMANHLRLSKLSQCSIF